MDTSVPLGLGIGKAVFKMLSRHAAWTLPGIPSQPWLDLGSVQPLGAPASSSVVYSKSGTFL